MIFRSIKNLLLSKDLSAQLKIFGIMKFEGSLIFYHAGIQTGLFKILSKPLTFEQLALSLKISNRQLLSSLLDLGCSLKELKLRDGKYQLKGSMAHAFVDNTPLTEIIRETVLYHADIASRLDTYLLKNEKGDYLKDFGGIIAESSRILEPMIKACIYHCIKKRDQLTILEFGCGSGEYLKYYVDINKNNSGMAIDIDASAVAIAQKKLKENNIEANFTVIQDNMMNPEIIKDKTFDLITSFSNMHYFSDDDRIKLFGVIHKHLNKNGRLLLATGFKNKSLSSSYYDIIFSATHGLYQLPRIEDVVRDLKKSGFTHVKIINIFDKSFKGISAFK